MMETYNAAVDLLGRNLVPNRARRPYLVTETRTFSYEEVAAAADGAGAGFLDLGLRPGDRIVLALQDTFEFVASFWGAIKAGMVPVPVAPGLAAADFQFMLADSGARAALCDLTSARAIVPAAAQTLIPCLFVGEALPEGTVAYADVCGRSTKLDAAATTREDIALWLYTSGTTGLPKAVMHRHSHLQSAPAGLARQVIGLGEDDLIYSMSKMFFAYGLGNSVYLPAAAGAAAVVSDGPSIPARVQTTAERMAPTVMCGVPAFFGGFVNLSDARLPSSVRVVISAGEQLPVELARRFHGRFGLQLLDGLGSTEALHHVTSNLPDDVVPGSAGRPLSGFEVQARNRDLQPVPEGESGELWVKGPTTFAGYWRRPELTAYAYDGGWMRTGDLVRVVDGRVFHEGRLDDLIKLGGVWVSPGEVEDILRGHPDVADAAVVTVDEEVGVPLLKAFVLSARDDERLASELRRLCRERLASFKVPKAFEVVPELPRTQTGKLQRFVLRRKMTSRSHAPFR